MAAGFTSMATIEWDQQAMEHLDRLEIHYGRAFRNLAHATMAVENGMVLGSCTVLAHLACFGVNPQDMATKGKILKTIAVAAAVATLPMLAYYGLPFLLVLTLGVREDLKGWLWESMTFVNLAPEFLCYFLPALSASAVMSKMSHHPHAA